MYSRSAKRSVIVGGVRTSISLEEAFWQRLKEIAGRRKVPVSVIVHEIAGLGRDTNLSSAIRTFILQDVDRQLDDCRRQLAPSPAVDHPLVPRRLP
jgi:predicted DNA-binding ribbon-helix-helix protein